MRAGLITTSVLIGVMVALSSPSVAQPSDDAQSRCLPTGPPPAEGYQSYDEAVQTRGQVVIPGVPGYLWRHGCGPTAAGMVIGYWDANGFPALIPGDASTQTDAVNQAIATGDGAATHYSDYSLPIDDTGTGLLPDLSELPPGDEHPSDCLGDYMRTSWSLATNYYGWSYFSDVAPAFSGYVGYVNQTYCAKYLAFAVGTSFGEFDWDSLVAQIDGGFPVVFLVDSDGDGGTDHFVTVIGYRNDAGVNQYACLDTWSPAGNIRWETFHGLATGVPWGVYGAITFVITGDCEDDTPPVVSDGFVGGEVNADCEYLLPFSGAITDDCCIHAGDVEVTVTLLSGNATLGTPTINITQNGVNQVLVDGTVLVSDLTSCPARVRVRATATDCCGNAGAGQRAVEIYDGIDPTISTCDAVSGEVDSNCEYVMPFTATVDDNCCVTTDAVTVGVSLLTGNATLGTPVINKVQSDQGQVTVTGEVLVSDLTGCPATVEVTVDAVDCCDNAAVQCVTTADVIDTIDPVITCPADVVLERGDKLCNSDVQDWLDSATATDNCDTDVVIVDDSAANGFACGFPYGTTTEVTWTATDDCGNTDECSAFITIKQAPRVDMTRKGSLLIFAKVELRWSATGELIQDTFLDITNDYPGYAMVQMYFVNGDEPLAAGANDRAHLGWNWVDNLITLTGDEPAYWSAATGSPKGVSPFTILDPSGDPLLQGRPCCDGTGDRALRGMVLAWAVNAEGAEIRWNHLKGDAILVHYGQGAAWEYNAWAFSTRCLEQGAEPLDCVDSDANGVCCNADVIPGNLDLDAFQYDLGFEQLILDFYAVGIDELGEVETTDTDLTLFPLDLDVRQETLGPVTTKAKFDIWNMNEVKFSGTERCITCWDQELLSNYEDPNHFLREHLQTNKGKARIDGMQSMLCPGSVEASLLGVSMKLLGFNAGVDCGMAGNNLLGAGYQSGRIQYDPSDEPPPELVQPTQPVGLSPELGSVGATGVETVKGVR